jgi:hypothetical protein
MRLAFLFVAHLAIPATEFVVHGMNPFTVLTAFVTCILASLAVLGHRLVSPKHASKLITIWVLYIMTVVIWLAAVILFSKVGLQPLTAGAG